MYTPPKEILEKYADLLVNFALNSGRGIKEGDVVRCVGEESTKPLLRELFRAVLKSGGHPLLKMGMVGIDKDFYDLANDAQLTFFPEKVLKERCDLMDHQIGILGTEDPKVLREIDSKKIFKSADSKKKIREWLVDKEANGKFTWTLGLFGTEGMAKEAGISLEEYWEVIIKACYLDRDNPIEEWKRIMQEIDRVKNTLNDLKIEKVHVESENIDLEVRLGQDRLWTGGSGRNIPSYEVFISPDWRGTNGKIAFDQPLYSYGNIIRGIYLEFKDGVVVNAGAEENEELLLNMIKRENANKVGEFSLTDSRLSRIDKFMANTLYDENVGGEYGNTHIALGMAYKDCFPGDQSKVTKDEWESMGYNYSPEHTDMISTKDRVVTATLSDGTSRVIYEDGKFTI